MQILTVFSISYQNRHQTVPPSDRQALYRVSRVSLSKSGLLNSSETSKPLEFHALGGQPFRIPSTVLSPLVTGRFGGVKGGSPNQRPWSLSHDGFMSLGFGPWLPISIDKSLVGYHVITRATGAGGLALWRTYAARFSLFPVNLQLCWTSSLGSRGASGGGSFWDFSPVAVASQKVPEPRVGEPVPWMAGGWGLVACILWGAMGIVWTKGRRGLFLCWVVWPVCRSVGLNGAASLSVVVIYGVLEVDFFCTLFLKIWFRKARLNPNFQTKIVTKLL